MTRVELTKKRTRTRVRKVLKEIVTILNHENNLNYEEARNLWCILTALRGPDNNDDALKGLTTSRIRGAMGLRHSNRGGAIVSYDTPQIQTAPMKENGFKDWDAVGGSHFISHYNAALEALKSLGFVKE